MTGVGEHVTPRAIDPSIQGRLAMKLRLTLLAATAALAACQAKTQQSVQNQFDQTEASIQNTANSIETATEVSTRAAANEIDAQANMISNRADAVERAATGRPPANASSNSHKSAGLRGSCRLLPPLDGGGLGWGGLRDHTVVVRTSASDSRRHPHPTLPHQGGGLEGHRVP